MGAVDRHTAISLLNETQRRAGVDDTVREMVNAYARLLLDQGRRIDWTSRPSEQVRARHLNLDAWIRHTYPDDTAFHDFLYLYAEELRRKNVVPILSTDHLASLWRWSSKQLWWHSYNADQQYRRFRIAKKRGGFRTIDAPISTYKQRLMWIHRNCLRRAAVHPAATGFLSGSSIQANAAAHVRKQVIVRIDLQNFFPTITHRQTRKAFESLGYPYRVAMVLAGLCTVRGRLPQGSPCSPALANLSCLTLDKRFAGLAKRLEFIYTRYADDLVFSSDRKDFAALIPFFKTIIREEGYLVNESKVAVMRPSNRQAVTGIVTNEKLNVRRDRYRTLRAMAHRYGQGTGNVSPQTMQGHIAFVESVSPPHAEHLRNLAYDEKRCHGA